MTERWCGRCRLARVIEWSTDIAFGPRAESARCPVCGAVWGVRVRRKGFFDRTAPPTSDEAEGTSQVRPFRSV